jgi:hypothetical protein
MRAPSDETSGAEGIRTPYLLNAIQALSQLSYSPTHLGDSFSHPHGTCLFGMDGAEGIRTPGLISAIDALSQLSYSPLPSHY